MGWIVVGICYLSTLAVGVYLALKGKSLINYQRPVAPEKYMADILRMTIDKQPELVDRISNLADKIGEGIAKGIGTFTGNTGNNQGAILDSSALSEEELKGTGERVDETDIVYPPWEDESDLMMKPGDKING